MPHSVLITSAGRRGKLVLVFRNELVQLLPGARVYAADARPELSVACQLTDSAFAVPRVDDAAYVPRLIEICTAHDIGLLVPTIDPELIVLAQYREQFASYGISVAVSDEMFVRTCRDKRQTAKWFAERELGTPLTVNPCTASTYPIFAKPYDGSCSRGARVIESRRDLTDELLNDERMMFVEYLAPSAHDEYTIDMYFDRAGELRCLVPRLRIETRGGEVSKGQTRRLPAVGALKERLRMIEGARGCITLQVFVERRSNQIYAIEINPRFGGGYPLSYEAGANFPRWLIQEYLLGERIEFFDGWESDLTMLRYDDHVVVRGAAA
jgi:carbamoyl-phosphate synthase large subunit